ncbi:MAG: hypothetical protein FJY82_02345 [Candidatus Aminicenantes bacterium]|nr:hypothetical protein [Candidatus Aminicenantes bacterium]
MKVNKRAILPALALTAASAAAADRLSFNRPEFDEHRRLVSIAREGEGRFFLFLGDPAAPESEAKPLALGPGAGLPVLKKDVLGRLWAVWIEAEAGHSRLAAASVPDGFETPDFFPCPADPLGPWDCGFDAGRGLWLVWVEETGRRRFLRVRDTASGRSWTISSGSDEANAPCFLRDARGHLWVFWTAAGPGREQVFGSRFDGSSWSRETRLSVDQDGPNISPAAAADREGNVWLAWSGYDGADYEILVRRWDGRRWLPTAMVTSDDRANDVFPRLDAAFGIIPVVSWVRHAPEGRRAMIRSGGELGWGEVVDLAPLAVERPFVPLAVQDDLAGLAFADRGSIRREWRFLPELAPPGRGRKRLPLLPAAAARGDIPARAGPIYNPSLEEWRFIAFGDSITYGICDEDRSGDPEDYIPEKSYPPRLESLLALRFGPHEVVNAGVPGESTIQGLSRVDALIGRSSARYILILEGTNDIIWNWYSLDTTSFNLEEMLRKSLEHGMLPALATTTPRFDHNADWPRQSLLNDRIRQLAVLRSVPLADLYQDFASFPEAAGGVTSLICWGEDRLHPNEKGYQFMAEKWFERILAFPFPPAETRIRRATDKILFVRTSGNLIEWRDSPKIADSGRIQEYRIYRKKKADPASAFKLLTTVAGRLSFFDRDISPSETYVYLISTVVLAGMEGPASSPLTR